jgi:RNA polymerase sigma-70 factor (ECF subfamily)
MAPVSMRKRSHDEFLAATLPALDLVYNLARRLVDADDVEDVVQETFTRAFDAWMKGRPPRKVEPWLATICLNTGRSWLRRASTRREIPTEPNPTMVAATDVSADAIDNVRREAIYRALWELPEEQRIAITLMDLDGFTASQVARMTGSPRGTVLARVHRGRKKLARILEKEVNRFET